jgi:hypothetical protein
MNRSIDLIELLTSCEVLNDKETDLAFFRTHVPLVAPEAYLHIIYKPVSKDIVLNSARRMKIPKIFIDFLSKQNGARLFSGSLLIFGVIRSGSLVRRDSPPPLNIEFENSDNNGFDSDRYLAVGGYGYDGSTICIDRSDGCVGLFHRDEKHPTIAWHDFDEWIKTEIMRLSEIFDTTGRILVNKSATVPHKIID